MVKRLRQVTNEYIPPPPAVPSFPATSGSEASAPPWSLQGPSIGITSAAVFLWLGKVAHRASYDPFSDKT